MKELLPDNVALLKRISEVNSSAHPSANLSRMKEISDPLSWVFCYLSFVAAKSTDPQTQDLLAYGQIVIELARKHAGLGWLTYDCLFRQQINAGSGQNKWNELNPSLMAATVLSSHISENSKLCSLCMTPDHLASDCALSSLESSRYNPGEEPSYTPYTTGRTEPCRRFNRGNCFTRACKFEHVCSNCFRGGYPAVECGRPKPESTYPAYKRTNSGVHYVINQTR